MLPVNIYVLTRVNKVSELQRLERQLSKRSYPLTIRKWEVESLRSLAIHLYEELQDLSLLEFYFSFQVPKLGKEFDLLRISDDYVVNIELKSSSVEDEKIKQQLMQNRHYLAPLGKTVRSYTYISSEDRLVRCTNGERLVEAAWKELGEDLIRQGLCYTDHIEPFFREENYLVSPLTDPERFLRHEYFLTAQQKDIRNKILSNVGEEVATYQGFTGLPGTGKTLLLYDIAMQLSWKQKVCIFHLGSFPDELKRLDQRLKRIDFFSYESVNQMINAMPCDSQDVELSEDILRNYSAILIDEGHRLEKHQLEWLVSYTRERAIPVIFSYDCEESISPKEWNSNTVGQMEQLPAYVKYQLTNRIRMNGELSSFIRNVMHLSKYHNQRNYPSVTVAYANTEAEKTALLHLYKSQGCIYIRDEEAYDTMEAQDSMQEIEASFATCKEFDSVVMVVDESFYYDEEDYLRSKKSMKVRKLFHGLNRAKKRLVILVWDNEPVFDEMLFVLQQGKKS